MLHTKHIFSITRKICKRRIFLNPIVWGLFVYILWKKKMSVSLQIKMKNNKKRECWLILIFGSDMKGRFNPKEIRDFSKAEFPMELLFCTGIYWIYRKWKKRKFYCRWMPMSTPQNTKSYIPAVDGLSCLLQKMGKEKILL